MGSGINTLLTVILVAVILFVLFRPGNRTQDIIHAIGGGQLALTKTLTGQYPGSGY